jgi:4-amino-4-deoxy-L-arabinose transferase-like glycosyltransferase
LASGNIEESGGNAPAPAGGEALLRTVVARRFWWCFAAVLALMAWNTFWRIDQTRVRDCDEARYGVAASEMLHGHSPLVTTYAGETEYWNLKPPLGYWLLELSFWLVGETPFGLRLPAALCALAAAGLTMLAARRTAGPHLAILAGIVLATSFGFLGHHGARSGELDAPLALLLLVFLVLAPWLVDSRPARLAAGLVLALGFLLKSFAILPFVAAVGVYCLITRGIASWRAWPLPLGIAAVTAMTWAVARSVAENSSEFVRRMFVEDLLLRSTSVIDPGASNGLWDYVGALFDRLAPWPLLVVAATCVSVGFARRRLASDFATLLWCFALIPLVVFTLAQTHHSHYIIPTYPAWAILAAAGALEAMSWAKRTGFAVTAAVLITAGMFACEARLVAQVLIHDAMPLSQVFLASLRSRRSGTTQSLRTAFVPSYSERFFLQVVDGFTLDDSTAGSEDSERLAAVGDTLLVRRRDTNATFALLATPAAAAITQQRRRPNSATVWAGR